MNVVAIVIATVMNMVLGTIWFGPLFGKTWMRLSGKSDMSGGAGANMGLMYGITAVGALISATTMAYFIGFGTVSLANGALIGLFAGVGLVGTAFLSSGIFLGWPFALYLITASYYALALVVSGAIIGALGK